MTAELAKRKKSRKVAKRVVDRDVKPENVRQGVRIRLDFVISLQAFPSLELLNAALHGAALSVAKLAKEDVDLAPGGRMGADRVLDFDAYFARMKRRIEEETRRGE